jgi:hypothetical protein
LGAQNIEQTKTLHHGSMQAIFGRVIKTPYNQRMAIKTIVEQNNKDDILRFNADLVNAKSEKDFYYDPHTKHYTGQLKTLATWCPSVRLADKGINMDFIHTTDGYPVYFNSTDNFYDLRERFLKNVQEFRSLISFPQDQCLTIIIDRGIFSANIFENIVNMPNMHIITWEKGYERDKWDVGLKTSKGYIVKTRNHKNDKQLVHYQYQERLWDKNPDMRQIIVQVLDKKWDVLIEVSILTDDKQRDTQQVIKLMLKRWVQENDFKYLIKHFGINEITTYAFVDYKDLKEKIEDKLYTCGEHKKLTKKIQAVRARLKTLLLRQYNFNLKHAKHNSELSDKNQLKLDEIKKQIEKFNDELKQLEKQRKESVNKVSKIDELIQEGYKKLDTDVKSYLDSVKILARNIFYLAFEPFKEQYDNYRDDHVLFRNLSTASGIVKNKNGKKHVELIPTMQHPKKIKSIFKQILATLNENSPVWPNEKNEKFEVFLQ